MTFDEAASLHTIQREHLQKFGSIPLIFFFIICYGNTANVQQEAGKVCWHQPKPGMATLLCMTYAVAADSSLPSFKAAVLNEGSLHCWLGFNSAPGHLYEGLLSFRSETHLTRRALEFPGGRRPVTSLNMCVRKVHMSRTDQLLSPFCDCGCTSN